MAGQFAYMRKTKGGTIEKVPLAKWAHYRRQGFIFSNEQEYLLQKAGKETEAPAADDNDELVLPTKADNKQTILAFASQHGIAVDEEDTKAELLAQIESALG